MGTPEDTNNENEHASNDKNANVPENTPAETPASGNVIDDFLNEISGGVATEQDHSDDAHVPTDDEWFKGQMRVRGHGTGMHFQLQKPSKEKQYTPFDAEATPEIVAKFVEMIKEGKVNLPSNYGSPAMYAPCEIAIDPDNSEHGFLMRLDGERFRFAGLSYDHGELTTGEIVGPTPTY